MLVLFEGLRIVEFAHVHKSLEEGVFFLEELQYFVNKVRLCY